MSRVKYGQVDIDLNGETHTLKPTLKAIMRIEQHFGGLRKAIECCNDLSAEGCWVIVSAGAGFKPNDEDMQKKVLLDAGVAVLMPAVTEYLMLLLNPTGKDLEGSEDSGE